MKKIEKLWELMNLLHSMVEMKLSENLERGIWSDHCVEFSFLFIFNNGLVMFQITYMSRICFLFEQHHTNLSVTQ